MRRCDPARIPYETTTDAVDLEEFVGQDRALEALRFGLAMRSEGYNLFAMGPPGVGKETLIRQLLAERVSSEPAPSDWCYVHNFRDPHRPRALEFPAGRGAAFRNDMERALTALQVAMRAAFDSDELRTRRQRLVSEVKQREERAFAQMQQSAQARQVAVMRGESGVMIAPLLGGSIIDPPTFSQLPESEQAILRAGMDAVGDDLEAFLRDLHDLGRDHLERMQALDRDTAAVVARRVIGEVRERYTSWPAVVEHLDALEADVVENAALVLGREVPHGPALRRYTVNLVIDNGSAPGAPVVFEPNPTLPNLIGRIGHAAQLGVLVSDFTQVKAGALHRACGGYLLLDALHLLSHPPAWEALKRALRAREVRIETIVQLEGLVPTASLEPDPIPLSTTKVVLVGDRAIHGLLSKADPDFLELFKVIVDFDEAMLRNPESERRYANLIASLVRKERLRSLDRAAAARVIEHASRLTGQADRMSVQMRPIADLLREADSCAGAAASDTIAATHVQAAIDAQLRRAGRVRDLLLQAVQEGRVLVDVTGERVGQVNGLSAMTVGEHQFGHPARITSRVRVGRGEVVDIEREVAMGGPIHSKGVLILAGFLGARYAAGLPLSLCASVVFEQSYVPVEGDSASLAELCALLSALAELPIRQSFAVTGSVSQHGDVQPVGGVNDKIEGFFDVCLGRGLTGRQGVVIPSANVSDLMLRGDVVEAVAAGRFAVVAVDDVDSALAWLTGRDAGARDDSGRYPEGTVNALVEARLRGFAESTRNFLLAAPAP